jgi:hypothetical protein
MRRVALEDLVKRPPRWRRWLWRLGCAVLVLVVCEAVRYGWTHRKATTRLAAAEAELDASDPGWRLADIEAGRAEVPEEENSARVVVAARALLPRNWPAPDFDDMVDKPAPNEQLNAQQAARLARELEAVRPAVLKARQLAGLPRGRYRIAYQTNVIATQLNEQAESRVIMALLRYDVLDRAQAADMKGAVVSCRALLNAARSLGDEPLALSQLIRMAGVMMACGCGERVLAQGEPNPADLATFQALLEQEDRHPRMRIMFRGERAMNHAMFDALERGAIPLGALTDGKSTSWQERWSGWRMRDNFRREHPLMLQLHTERIAAVGLPLHEQIEADKQFQNGGAGLPPDAILTRLMLPAAEKLGAAVRRTHALVRCLTVLLATERYRRAQGRWPARLAELTPKYLAAVPLDPFDGKPLRYRRLADGVMVYSVGQDGTDDGGVLHRNNPIRDGADLGYQLWDVVKRRQPPRPAPPLAPPGGAPPD